MDTFRTLTVQYIGLYPISESMINDMNIRQRQANQENKVGQGMDWYAFQKVYHAFNHSSVLIVFRLLLAVENSKAPVGLRASSHETVVAASPKTTVWVRNAKGENGRGGNRGCTAPALRQGHTLILRGGRLRGYVSKPLTCNPRYQPAQRCNLSKFLCPSLFMKKFYLISRESNRNKSFPEFPSENICVYTT